MVVWIRVEEGLRGIVVVVWGRVVMFWFFGKEFVRVMRKVCVVSEGMIEWVVLVVGEFEGGLWVEMWEVFCFV